MSEKTSITNQSTPIKNNLQDFVQHEKELSNILIMLVESREILDSGCKTIAGYLPNMAKELRNASERVNCLVKGLFLVDELEKSNFGGELGEVTKETILKLKSITKDINYILKGEDSSFKGIQALIELIEKIKVNIDNSYDTYMDIELLSLNSIIFAAKTEEGGTPLVEVAEALNRTSVQTLVVTENVMDKQKDLFNDYVNFKDFFQKLITFQAERLTNIPLRSEELYNSLIKAIKTGVDQLKDKIDKIQEVNRIIGNIMLDLQHQDILRQCIDHLVMSIEDMIALKFDEISSSLLDHQLNFYENLLVKSKVTNLCIKLLEDVGELVIEFIEKLKHHIFDIKDSLFSKVDRQLEDLKDRGDVLLTKETEKTLGAIEDMFLSLDQIKKDILETVNHTTLKEKEILDVVLRLDSKFKELEKGFQRLYRTTKKLKVININFHIEIARSESICQDNFITATFSDIMQNIDNISEGISGQLQEVKSIMLCLIKACRSNNSNRIECLKKIEEDVNVFTNGFFTINNTIKRFISFLSSCLINLVSLSDAALNDLNTIEAIFARNKKIKGIFEGQQRFYDKEILLYKEKYPVPDNDNYMQKVKSIVDKFTVITHKMIADELYSLGIEKGDASGNVTLF
ncbi:MAG: hypothetical protein V1872_13790 [bacterium]